MPRTLAVLSLLVAGAVAASGCGSSGSTSTTAAAAAGPMPSTPSSSTTDAAAATRSVSAPGALVGEAGSAAAGDIPDDQSFLVFRDRSLRFSMRYPEGWVIRRKAHSVTFRDKNNVARVTVASGAASNRASIRRSLGGTAKVGAISTVSLPGGSALKVTYRTVSQANPVTGRRVTLTVDRYVIAANGRSATVDLGTPAGVDNVDAYRMMVRSFRWR